MKKLSRRLLALSIPVVLFATIWGIVWRRSHPAPTAWDTHCRTTLLTADSVAVTVYTWKAVGIEGFAVRRKVQEVTRLEAADMLSVATSLNVTQAARLCADDGFMCNPTMDFNFYAAGRIVGGFTISDHEYTFTDSKAASEWTLHPSSVRRLREFIRQHPDIEQAARKARVEF